MNLSLVVLLCGIVAALLAFGLSASRRAQADPIDPSAEQQAVRRSLRRHPRVERFLRERMDRRTAGGFLLTASFVILLVVALVLGVLLDMIDNHSGLAAADKSVAEWGSRHGDTSAAHALKWVTQLGSTLVVSLSLLIAASVDFVRRRSREVFAFVAAVGLGELLLNNFLKLIVHRERPAVLHLVVAHGYSFPSGHTAAAAAAWSGIALVLGRDRPRIVRAVLAGGAALIAISVAASRALLGVHWLTDVVGGLALGWGWFMIVAIIFGGRAQRLGDPVSGHPQTKSTPANA
ncbi:MAG: phosphatase PAP2 family protein [Ilumatobacteraceae bacterium]